MKHLILTLAAGLAAVACGNSQTTTPVSAPREIMCTQIYGALYNPETNECKIYRNGCEASDLQARGFTQEVSEESCHH